MSEENITESSLIELLRRERRITIRLHKPLCRTSSASSRKAREFIEHKGPKPSFEAGDDISGVVGLEVKCGRPVTKLRLALVCLNQIRWKIYPKRKSIIAVFTGEEPAAVDNQIYFDRKTILQIDLAKGAETNKFADGKYEFPFRFILPEDGLASTMTSCHGFIKYTIEVFATDEDQVESRSEKEIIVVAPMHDKLDAHGRSLEKSFHVLGGGKITLSARSERKEYVPGDTVTVEITIINDSSIEVEPRVSLYQTQAFTYNQVIRTLETCLAEPTSGSSIVPAQTATQIVRVELPATSLISLRGSLITVKYFVHITLDIPNSIDLQINLPFVVTTRRARQRQHALVSTISDENSQPKYQQQLQQQQQLPQKQQQSNLHSASCHQLQQKQPQSQSQPRSQTHQQPPPQAQQNQTYPNILGGRNRGTMNDV